MNGLPRPDQPPLTLDHKAGRIIQYAYTVPDLAAAMHSYTDLLHVGPWFRRGPLLPPRAQYRGGPSGAELNLARAFSGDPMIELIQQHNDAPRRVAVREYGLRMIMCSRQRP